jgi:hypothetical protein
MRAADTLLSSEITDPTLADFLFREDRRRHDRRALDHYRTQLAAATKETTR